MTTTRLTVVFAISLCAIACGHSGAVPESGVDMRREAEAFMKAYGDELRAYDRDAIIGRYHPQGVFMQGNGTNEFSTADKVRTFYRTIWEGPEKFEFANLTYETLGPDAVAVIGVFRWTAPGKLEETYSYTGILMRLDGKLRIRLEHESQKATAP
jgi:hypothetical protein